MIWLCMVGVRDYISSDSLPAPSLHVTSLYPYQPGDDDTGPGGPGGSGGPGSPGSPGEDGKPAPNVIVKNVYITASAGQVLAMYT